MRTRTGPTQLIAIWMTLASLSLLSLRPLAAEETPAHLTHGGHAAPTWLAAVGPDGDYSHPEILLPGTDIPKVVNPRPLGPLVLKTYQFPQGQAAAITAALQQQYKGHPWVRIKEVGTDCIVVKGGPDDHKEVAKQIVRLLPGLPAKPLPKKQVDALQQIVGGEGATWWVGK